MKQRVFFCLFIFLSCFMYSDDNDLLNDYKLLYIDLLNMKTWGYKSFYSKHINRSSKDINISQGTIQITGYNFNCAIVGEGFFKIRLENNIFAYTRNGEFHVDSSGALVTSQGYPLYESICLPEYFLSQSFKITRDHTIYVNIPDGSKGVIEIKSGTLSTYKISNEYLEYYKDAIYIIKDNTDYEEKLTLDNYIIQGALELGNYELLPVILRMYYILSILDKNTISNIEFKKELLKIPIEKMANNNYCCESNTTEECLASRLHYLETILPFIKWDY